MRTFAARRAHRLLRSVLATVALAAVVGAPTIGLDPAPARAADEPLYTLDVTPTTGLVDGQSLDVTVRARPGIALDLSGLVYICRDGPTYASVTDVVAASGNCPAAPMSSSATPSPILRSYPDQSTAVTSMRVGVGTVEWGPSDADPSAFSLTCDPTHPCRLVVSILADRNRTRIVDSTLLTFASENVLAACGGTEPDAIATGGSDRLTGAWIEWTKGRCGSQPGTKAATQAIFAGEGEGHRAFATGLADLTYSGVGPSFIPGEVTPARGSVSVPLALNAAVIGVLGGYPTNQPDWPAGVAKPFADVKATMPELATLFGTDPFAFDIFHSDALRARNPELARSPIISTSKTVPMAPAGAESATWYATQAFDRLAGDQWVSSPIGASGNVPNTPRGVHESLAQADPPFSISFIELYSAQGQLKRVAAINQFVPQVYGPIWVLTDLATAREIGIPTVAIPNSSGEFVQPTDESLLAAVPDLELQPDGTYLPTIGDDASGGVSTNADAPGAYPLTFVEHAVAPTEPLVDDSCAPRTGSQQLLADWLAYLTGPGQAELPDGLVALPPELAAQATAERALVGAAPLTGDCAPSPPTDPGVPPAPGSVDPPGGPGLPSGADSTFGGGSGLPGGSPGGSPGGTSTGGGAFGAGSGNVGGPDGGLPTDELAAGTGDGDMNVAEISYPGPAGGSSGNGLATGLAIVALAVLVAVGGALSTGKRPHLRRGGTS